MFLTCFSTYDGIVMANAQVLSEENISVNGEKVVEIVGNVVNKYEDREEKLSLSAFVSDNAPYMLRAARLASDGNWGESIPEESKLSCLSHGLSLVVEKYSKPFSSVNRAVALMKSYSTQG